MLLLPLSMVTTAGSSTLLLAMRPAGSWPGSLGAAAGVLVAGGREEGREERREELQSSVSMAALSMPWLPLRVLALPDGVPVSATGWGAVGEGAAKANSAVILRVDLRLMGQRTCETRPDRDRKSVV